MFSFSIKSLLEREDNGSFLPVEGEWSVERIPLGTESLRAITPISVRGRITKLQEGLLEFRGVECVTLEMACDRCLTSVTVPLEVNSTIRFYSEKAKDFLREEDYDALPIEDESIDLDQVIFHDIQLGIPMKVLCREDCQGLCPVCGKNLNQGACGCREIETDPRWDLLKSIADTLEQEV